jgi:type IV pilus assembly protein PilX
MSVGHQRGTVLLLSMVLLLLLGMLGLLAMQSSTQQTRMASNLLASMQALEAAENLMRTAEARLSGAVPEPCGDCLPPAETATGWQQAAAGRYLIQNLGRSDCAFGMPNKVSVTLFRISVIADQRQARVALESVVAVPLLPEHGPARRVLWRQIYRES